VVEDLRIGRSCLLKAAPHGPRTYPEPPGDVLDARAPLRHFIGKDAVQARDETCGCGKILEGAFGFGLQDVAELLVSMEQGVSRRSTEQTSAS
jgi:hypothetical protein